MALGFQFTIFFLTQKDEHCQSHNESIFFTDFSKFFNQVPSGIQRWLLNKFTWEVNKKKKKDKQRQKSIIHHHHPHSRAAES